MTREQTNIDQLMLDKGIKRDSDLADMIGVSTSTFSLSVNKGSITLRTLEKISKALNVTVKELIK